MQTVSAQLSWSHYCELLSIKSVEEIKYYMQIAEIHSLSVRQLRDKIKNREFQRLPIDTKGKLINSNLSSVVDFIKDPILIKNNYNYIEI